MSVWLPFWRGPVDRKQNHKGYFYPAMTVSSPTSVPEATTLSTTRGGWAFPLEAPP